MFVFKRLILAILLAAVPSGGVPQDLPRLMARKAPRYSANPKIGPGGDVFKDSAHFRVYGNNGTEATQALSLLEAAYDCFVGTLGFRSTGISFWDTSTSGGPRTKTNVYSVDELPGAAGVMQADHDAGLGWLIVQKDFVATSGVTVHEYGHVLHYHQRTWVEQSRTGAWWETFANWVADTYGTSDLCAPARRSHKRPIEATEINLWKLIGDSFQPLIDGSVGTGNYYEAFPFFTYLTNNPDKYAKLGTKTLLNMMTKYKLNSNETPLHTLQRITSKTPVADIIGSYWARMAYVDIGHTLAYQAFLDHRQDFNYANVDSKGKNIYTVKPERRPQYMGANIIPLTTTGGRVTVKITTKGLYRATLVVHNDYTTRYVKFRYGSATVSIESGEEISLVVAHTPGLILYDPFDLSLEAKQGLDYSFALSGAAIL
ncbi:Ff.00g040850.m01.CDS01 [Fusarium sp. VM40]|nr:Ff.00g040850.m01.CDS01 [Fusarium sp. VM40]